MKKTKKLLFGLLCSLFIGAQLTSISATELSGLDNNPNVTIKTDGIKVAFDVDYMQIPTAEELASFQNMIGTIVDIENVVEDIAVPGIGQHLYNSLYDETILDIDYWIVGYSPGQCIHNSYGSVPYDSTYNYYGFTVNTSVCLGYYYPGWLGVCADCGEVCTPYIYASPSSIATIAY
ncbi:MAG: hypothetical protein R3Y47_07150 [Lachnospiraceae bacterium]